MIFRFGLIEMELLKFLDLKKLTERDEQIVLSKLAILQKNFTRSGKRVRVGCFSFGLQTSFDLPPRTAARPAGFGDDLIRLHAAKFQIDMEGRLFRFRLHCKAPGHIAAADVRGNLRKVQTILVVSKRRFQLLDKKTITQRDSRNSGVAL